MGIDEWIYFELGKYLKKIKEKTGRRGLAVILIVISIVILLLILLSMD